MSRKQISSALLPRLPQTRPLYRAVAAVLAGCTLAAEHDVAWAQTIAPATGGTADPAVVKYAYDIPAGALTGALLKFTEQSGIPVITGDAQIDQLSSPAVRGNLSASEALEQLLRGSGYGAIRDSGGYTLTRSGRIEEEIVVLGFRAVEQGSATKMPMSIRETPQAISVTTRESMDMRQVRDLTSALELTAGLTSGIAADGGPFAGRGLGGGEGFLLRGQELDGRRDVRMDGFVVASRVFDMAAFERIEVVKGPSSVLYGQGSLGGFINMIRRKPQAAPETTVVGQIASWDTYRAEIDTTGALEDSERYLGRITASFEDGDSFTDHVETQLWMVAPSLSVELTDDTTLLTQVLYQRDDYTPSRGTPLRLDGNELKIPNIPDHLFTGVPSQQESWGETYLATAELDHQLNDDWLVSLLFQKSGVKTERYFDAYSNACCLTTSGDVYMYSDTSRSTGDSWAGELRLDGSFEAFGRDHLLLLGYEYAKRDDDLAFGYTYLGPGNLYTREFQADNIIPGGAGNQPFDFDFTNDNEDQGLYAQTLLALTDRLRLLLGARYDDSKIDHKNKNTGQLDSQTDGEWTMRSGLTADITENITGYAVYAQTFNPTVDARSESGAILEPETGEGLEAGLKTEWFDARLGVTLAVFRQELDNIPIEDPNNRLFSINGGLQRTDGVELEASGVVTDGFTLGAAATWLDAEYREKDDPNYGLEPWGLIDQQFSVFARYDLQSGPLQDVGVGIFYIDVGDRTQLGKQHLPGYERVDLNFYYTGLPKWDFSLQVRNLTDERYIERLRDQYQDNFFGAPRAFLFRTEYRF